MEKRKDKKEYIKEKQEKVQELLKQVKEGARDFYESDKYKQFLGTMAKFHTYSANNIMLMLSQNPNISLVAGYNSWRDKFNRHVKKGETELKIFIYTPYKTTERVPKLGRNGDPIYDRKGNLVTDLVETLNPAFSIGTVFDVSQTEGEPLPELVTELKGKAENYKDFIEVLTRSSKAPISFGEIEGDTKGYYVPGLNTIKIKEGMGELQTIKTLLHEIAHSELHTIEAMEDDPKNKHTKEVEAESVAYVVSQYYGLYTSEYSFGYIATWSSDKDLSELHQSMKTISDKAEDLITKMDKEFESLRIEKAKEAVIEWCEEVHGESEHLFDNGLEDVGIAYTTSDDLSTDVQFSLNLIENTYSLKIDDFTLETGTYDNVREFLDGATFDDVVHIDETLLRDKLGFEINQDCNFQDIEVPGYITYQEMLQYGYHWIGMQPLTEAQAIDLVDKELYLLSPNDSESLLEYETREERIESIREHYRNGGMIGLEKENSEWIRFNKERLDSLIHDNEIDLDREKKPEPERKEYVSIKDRLRSAQDRADVHNNTLNKSKERSKDDIER